MKTKKLAYFLLKGGIGKTTLCANVSTALARKGFKTVIVDGDLQGNISSHFITKDIQYDLVDVLTGKATLEQTLVQLEDNLWILPVIPVGSTLKNWAETQLPQNPKAFEFLNLDLADRGFKFVCYDLSPSMSILERTIIADVDEVINPILLEEYSFEGVELWRSYLDQIKKANRKEIRNDKLVVNMFNKSFSRHKLFLEQVEKLQGFQIFTIYTDSKIGESSIYHQSLFDYAPKSRNIEGFNTIADSLINEKE
jgi:cellulose biosynthesis protein BcsQ